MESYFNPHSTEKYPEYFFKILLIGTANVGKISIILHYVNSKFDDSGKSGAQLGVDFTKKAIEYDSKIINPSDLGPIWWRKN